LKNFSSLILTADSRVTAAARKYPKLSPASCREAKKSTNSPAEYQPKSRIEKAVARCARKLKVQSTKLKGRNKFQGSTRPNPRGAEANFATESSCPLAERRSLSRRVWGFFPNHQWKITRAKSEAGGPKYIGCSSRPVPAAWSRRAADNNVRKIRSYVVTRRPLQAAGTAWNAALRRAVLVPSLEL
jgi:hypothetical protein